MFRRVATNSSLNLLAVVPKGVATEINVVVVVPRVAEIGLKEVVEAKVAADPKAVKAEVEEEAEALPRRRLNSL